MENKTKFSYKVSVTAPKEYPVEVYCGYLSTDKNFITTVPKDGIERQGWIAQGSSSGSGGSTIPNFVELTWLSYAEKKFWKLETQLPTDKMLALFREGFIFKNSRKNDTITHETYDRIVIGTAPGGVVVIWLDGGLKRVEIGRYQAKDTIVDRNNFYRNPKDLTQEEFYKEGFEIDVSKEIQAKINKEGIPFGLWDNYRKKYNWRFNCNFYKDDKNIFQNINFFNGEYITLYEDELKNKAFKNQALPYRADITFNTYWCENEFDEKEIFDAFKTMDKKHPDADIEIEVRPDFMYKSVQFTVKCKEDEILLKKTKVQMWKRNLEK
ncbi:DUF2931 family protein [Flavobacterium sp. FlaQc-47]|uniref:DUF2931 family protein n=1 Tax=Flavobacterium sp. FlaQc-47 TaxID=3374180 RepID=UPI003756380D